MEYGYMSLSYPEDGSILQNTPTLAKTQRDINTNTWTFQQQYSNYSALEAVIAALVPR